MGSYNGSIYRNSIGIVKLTSKQLTMQLACMTSNYVDYLPAISAICLTRQLQLHKRTYT